MYKKFLNLIVISILSLSVFGCGSKEEQTEIVETDKSVSESVLAEKESENNKTYVIESDNMPELAVDDDNDTPEIDIETQEQTINGEYYIKLTGLYDNTLTGSLMQNEYVEYIESDSTVTSNLGYEYDVLTLKQAASLLNDNGNDYDEEDVSGMAKIYSDMEIILRLRSGEYSDFYVLGDQTDNGYELINLSNGKHLRRIIASDVELNIDEASVFNIFHQTSDDTETLTLTGNYFLNTEFPEIYENDSEYFPINDMFGKIVIEDNTVVNFGQCYID